MKASQRTFAMGLLGCMALFAAPSVHADSDLETCQGGYKVLLMTPGECRAYLNDLRAARVRADYATMLDLQEWHTELLIERAQTCPCRPHKATLAQDRAGARMPAQVANSTPQP